MVPLYKREGSEGIWTALTGGVPDESSEWGGGISGQMCNHGIFNEFDEYRRFT